MNERLSSDAIAERLAALDHWTQSGDALQRTAGFASFVHAMAFVNRIATIAEEQQHHPDILVRYDKVTLTLSTHDAGGITEKDFALAAAIDAVAEQMAPGA
ncbi:MAG TPA: 4a-hydroxytetrahydrobiopterin dehydratase [Phycisphaerales bacterium]|nr:4a-hydroxytetrahydrobiopterin dehydratase [Phycisphaerales bacterium]HMP38326.1 4a-hydroxytetrahydrobiopterin dehydratase [Phycisphaerales bacterium]